MQTTVELLDRARAELGLPSDYALAKRLGVSGSQLGNYRSGRSTMDNTTAAKMAELLGMDPLAVIAMMEVERAKTSERRAYWQRLGGTAASACVVAVLAMLVAAELAPLPSPGFYPVDNSGAMCIMFNLACGVISFSDQTLICAFLILILALWRRRRPA